MKKQILQFLVIFCVISSTINAYEIRLYKSEDKPVLMKMVTDNPDLLYPGNTLDERISKTEPYFGSKNYTTQVCVEGNATIGFVTYQKTFSTVPKEEDLGYMPYFEAIRHQGFLEILNVLKEHRQKGIGSSLLEHALDDMKKIGFDSVVLQTKTANRASRSLYEKHGFILMFPVVPEVQDCFYKLTLKK